MFSKKLTDWIYSFVRDDYKGDILRDISLFEKAISLKATDKNLEGINTVLPELLEGMCSSSMDFSRIQENLNGLTIEPYLKHLFSVLFPARYNIPPRKEIGGLDFSEWTLVPLLKQAFGIIPKDYNISSRKPETTTFPYKEFYDLAYSSRNLSAHGYMDMGPRKIFEVITATLIVYLDASSKVSSEIEEAYNKANISSAFSAKEYCNQIIKEYEKRVDDGFTYIDIKWKSSESSGAEYSTVFTMISKNSSRQVKLLGEAGCGKTTIMRQLEYMYALNYVNGITKIVPIFIQLGNIESDSSLSSDISLMASSILNIDVQLFEQMLSLNNIVLFLDGFNEVLDSRLKRQIAWSIDSLSAQYPSLKIFLSDRSLVRSAIETMKNAVSYKLYPLDNKIKESFFRYNSPDEATKNLLLIDIVNKPSNYDKYDTPIKLKQLIELTHHSKRLPVDFDEEYIKFLFEREMIDKKDENVEYLESFACALAICKDEKFSEYKAEACIAKCKTILGYTVPDSRKCLRLLIEMGILSFEDGVIEFKQPSYRTYFWATAFDRGLVDLLED